MQVNHQDEMTLLQFDNPSVILLRGGVSIHYPQEELVIDGKKVIKSVVKVKPNDIFLTMSDGALYAGVGKMYNYGCLLCTSNGHSPGRLRCSACSGCSGWHRWCWERLPGLRQPGIRQRSVRT